MMRFTACTAVVWAVCSLTWLSGKTTAANTSTFVGFPGVPGSPGLNGSPGRDGRDGRDGTKAEIGVKGERGVKGEIGAKGEMGEKGSAGLPGIQGPSGINGRRGLDGEIGAKGNAGKVGPRGPPGLRGVKGLQGDKGSRGDKGEVEKINWKQCVWYKEDGKDSGLIQNCGFIKYHNNTALNVAYGGDLRVLCRSGWCCSRWFFTFNGQECSGPMPIDGTVYRDPGSSNPHSHRQIEGYCENVPAGQVTIGLNIGACKRKTNRIYDGYTGHMSVSRIMIQEVPLQQA